MVACCSSSGAIAVATVFAICAVTLIALGFSTNNWQEIEVRTDNVQGEADSLSGYRKLTYYDRRTGLFRICFPDQVSELDQLPDKPSADCIKQEAEIPERDVENEEQSDEYWTRVHLLRATIAFLIVCLLFLLIGIFLGFIGCWRMNVMLARCAAVFVLLGAFFGAGGMAMWHGAEYLEWEKIPDKGLYKVLDFPQSWTQTLSDNTEKSYGWSYIVMWIGVGLAFISGILYLVSAATMLYKRAHVKDSYDGRLTMDRHSRSHSPYVATKERYNTNTMIRAPEQTNIVYAYDANYLKKQPYSYPESENGGATLQPVVPDHSNSWGWNAS